MTEPKSIAELREMVRIAAARNDERGLAVSIRPVFGENANWDCTVKYTDPRHGWGPTPAFIKELADLKRRFHLE